MTSPNNRGVEPAASPRKTAAPIALEPVDFNHPPRRYVARRLHGWDVWVEKQLADEDAELARVAVDRLDRKLGEAAAVLPANAVPDLRRLKIFLMYGARAEAGGRSNGLQYFGADAPVHHDWLDARMASGIVIFSADNYAQLSDFWALKALVHEFGHAWHLEHWPENHADVFDTWQAAMRAGLYQVVRDEDRDTHHPNYAAQNHLEYFAELSAAYFVGSNYHPRDRVALGAYDPAGYALVESLWGIVEQPARAGSGPESP